MKPSPPVRTLKPKIMLPQMDQQGQGQNVKWLHLGIGLCASEYQFIAFSYTWVMFKEGFGREEDTAEFPTTKPAQLNLTGMFRGLCWIINAWYHITSHASSQRHLWIFSCLTGEETTPEMREGLTHLLWGLKWAMQCPGTALCSPGTPSDSATFPWEDRGAATCKPSWAA